MVSKCLHSVIPQDTDPTHEFQHIIFGVILANFVKEFVESYCQAFEEQLVVELGVDRGVSSFALVPIAVAVVEGKQVNFTDCDMVGKRCKSHVDDLIVDAVIKSETRG